MKSQNGDQKFGLERQDDEFSTSSLLFFFMIIGKSRKQRKSLQHGVTKCWKSGLRISKRVKQDCYRHSPQNLFLRK